PGWPSSPATEPVSGRAPRPARLSRAPGTGPAAGASCRTRTQYVVTPAPETASICYHPYGGTDDACRNGVEGDLDGQESREEEDREEGRQEGREEEDRQEGREEEVGAQAERRVHASGDAECRARGSDRRQ